MPPFRHTLRVRYQECDPQGVVYFARYPEYADIALTEMFREALGSYDAMVQGGSDLVVAEMTVRYHASARFDDLVDVDLAVSRLGETSLGCAVRMLRGDELLAEADFRHVFIDVDSKDKRAMPADVRSALERYAPA